MEKLNFIDIFAGCGGLSEGFKKNSKYKMLAAVEWEKPQVVNLINRLEKKWGYKDASKLVLRFDIQRTEELFNGWQDDEKYGTHLGLDTIVGEEKVDLIIGGPPCQAYSLAGRIRDENGMKDDYRNYLFESYMKIVRRYQPRLFVFENVPGMLSAKPGGTPVTTLIREEIKSSGYSIISDLKAYAQLNLSDFGIPQNRKRVIIIGLRNDLYLNPEETLKKFYLNELVKYKEDTKTVRDAISDLPKLYPLTEEVKEKGKKYSHSSHRVSHIHNHIPRYHSVRDIKIFDMLTKDIENQEFKYTSAEALKKLYTEMTGKTSSVHKYHVLRWDQPSNTIPAHLYKDGLRHIHPDSTQSRSITVREAARLQTFDDDYEFISSNGDNYKMIGNAVPPKFAYKLAMALLAII